MTVYELNKLSRDQAEAEFLKCCGSTKWAQLMFRARPFQSAAELLQRATEVCSSLAESDWLEAFRAHPKIGEKKAAASQSQQEQEWSAQEQSRVTDAVNDMKAALAKGNLEYEQRFGFIFIVCAVGKGPSELLEILQSRLQNDRATELRMAADEQRKITKLRLERLLNQ